MAQVMDLAGRPVSDVRSLASSTRERALARAKSQSILVGGFTLGSLLISSCQGGING